MSNSPAALAEAMPAARSQRASVAGEAATYQRSAAIAITSASNPSRRYGIAAVPGPA
jgi:hypothetical protein